MQIRTFCQFVRFAISYEFVHAYSYEIPKTYESVYISYELNHSNKTPAIVSLDTNLIHIVSTANKTHNPSGMQHSILVFVGTNVCMYGLSLVQVSERSERV